MIYIFSKYKSTYRVGTFSHEVMREKMPKDAKFLIHAMIECCTIVLFPRSARRSVRLVLYKE